MRRFRVELIGSALTWFISAENHQEACARVAAIQNKKNNPDSYLMGRDFRAEEVHQDD